MAVLAKNKKARHKYEILEKYTAGIVLNGQEVKSIKKGKMSLSGSFVALKNGEVFLLGANIPPYQPKNSFDYDSQRTRKLLLKKREINKITGILSQKGLTMAPLKVYTVKNKIKIEFAIVKNKKKRDKREKIKKREIEREIRRVIAKKLKMRG